MATRECPYCGRMVFDKLTQCNFCRERLPQMPTIKLSSSGPSAGSQIRRGLLFMLAAASIGYFASGNSALMLPVQVPSAVATYLSPLLFLSGLGLSAHGLYLRHWQAQ